MQVSGQAIECYRKCVFKILALPVIVLSEVKGEKID